MKGKLKWIIGLVAVVLVAILLYNRFFKKEAVVEYETRPSVSVETPKTGDIVLYTDLTGEVEPASKATVMPKISGEVLEVLFQAGDQVTAGQALVTIDSDSLTALKLQMDAAQVALTNANNTLSRTSALYADGFVSQEAMEQAQSGAESARISYETAKNQYDLQVKYMTVTAPMDGVIESRNVEPHDHINGETEICVISGQNQLQIRFGVTERILQNLAVGDSVTVEKNGSSYEGTVTEIGSMVNASTGLYDVKATVAQADGLTNGTRVKLTVVMDQAKGVLTVPVDAVSYDAGVPFVYCDVDGVAKKTEFEAGIYDSDRMQVVSGLTADDQVIVTWSNELVDGQAVLTDSSSQDQPAESGSGAAESGEAEGSDAAKTSSGDDSSAASSAADDGQVSAE